MKDRKRRKIRRLCARDLNSVGNRFFFFFCGVEVYQKGGEKKGTLLGCNPDWFFRQLREKRSSSEIEW